MKKFSRWLGYGILVSFSLCAVFMFQNCSGYSADYNPLFDAQVEDLTCQGINCAPDIASTQIHIGNQTGILQTPPAGYIQNTSVCDPYTCVDFGGYCDTGGMSGSVFYFQWQLNGLNFGGQIRTGYTCDSTGRFRITVQTPAGYNYAQLYTVIIKMTVIDTTGIEQDNPRGTNTQQVSIMTAQ